MTFVGGSTSTTTSTTTTMMSSSSTSKVGTLPTSSRFETLSWSKTTPGPIYSLPSTFQPPEPAPVVHSTRGRRIPGRIDPMMLPHPTHERTAWINGTVSKNALSFNSSTPSLIGPAAYAPSDKFSSTTAEAPRAAFPHDARFHEDKSVHATPGPKYLPKHGNMEWRTRRQPSYSFGPPPLFQSLAVTSTSPGSPVRSLSPSSRRSGGGGGGGGQSSTTMTTVAPSTAPAMLYHQDDLRAHSQATVVRTQSTSRSSSKKGSLKKGSSKGSKSAEHGGGGARANPSQSHATTVSSPRFHPSVSSTVHGGGGANSAAAVAPSHAMPAASGATHRDHHASHHSRQHTSDGSGLSSSSSAAATAAGAGVAGYYDGDGSLSQTRPSTSSIPSRSTFIHASIRDGMLYLSRPATCEPNVNVPHSYHPNPVNLPRAPSAALAHSERFQSLAAERERRAHEGGPGPVYDPTYWDISRVKSRKPMRVFTPDGRWRP